MLLADPWRKQFGGAPSLLEADQADSAHWVSAFFFTASGAGYYLQAAKVITIQQGPIVFN